ncbi:two-partner secretion domain-containing protein [Phormidium sp. CCY1219]|uniref:two-partner secretion domain-containing protein n=1 Tax=Phormidium sp. CCY1219 TaxID=2886104 RepID=UPI002D1EFEC6|nr:filamentous hemagglutinin N-terminal domain-containing protein [Phormidium sp. CCY1219]MEB3827571.1 S-layer family protein [Phormidium sp. CCY1219]
MKPQWNRLFGVAGYLAVLTLMPMATVRAQIAGDGTLPTQVIPGENGRFAIEGGARVGDRLFHSFREFSIPTGGAAVFENPPEVQTIINRVTGNEISHIDGILKANGGADLFVLNPNGVIFGPNASLEIGGSVVVSSADRLLFADGTEFSARDGSAPPLLTLSVPVGLQFGANPGPIVNQSVANPDETLGGVPRGLQVGANRTLALVGGEVRLSGGFLTPPGGRVELGSVAGNSEVRLNSIPSGFALSYDPGSNFRDITLSGGATIDVTDRSPGGGSGAVQVQGRHVRLLEGSQIASFTDGSVSAGPIAIAASESVELIGTGTRGSVVLPTNIATTTVGDANAADLRITTKRAIVRDGAGIFTSSVAFPTQNPQGGAGNLTIHASESVEIRGDAEDLPSTLEVETRTDGDAGGLEIFTGRLMVREGGKISASTRGSGRGGTIAIFASESVDISGSPSVNPAPADGAIATSSLIPGRIEALSEGAGDAGNLRLETDRLRIADGGQVAVSATATGAAGNLEIHARDLQLDRGGTLSAESAAGTRGSIRLQARDIELRRNSSITTTATGTASGGNVTFTTGTLTAVQNSQILANAIQGAGGNIQIDSQGLFIAPDSLLSASSEFGVSGTIAINTPEVDPSSGLVELPTQVQDPSGQIVIGCAGDEGNSFTVTGRGGIPADPTATIRPQILWRDLQDFSPADHRDRPSQSAATPPIAPSALPLVEARGFAVDARGNVRLVADKSARNPDGFWHPAAQCPLP